MNAKTHSTGKYMLIATSLTMLAKLVAVFRQIVLTYCYGAGSVSDAYVLAQSIPNTLFVLVSTAIGVSFIPVFSKVFEEEGDKKAKSFVDHMISLVLLLAGLLVVLVLLFSEQIIFLFAAGFDAQTAALAAQFLRISIFGIFFIGMVGILSSYLKIKNDYFSPSIIGIALSAVEIVSCILAAQTHNVLLAIGILAANIVQWLILAIACLKKGYRYRPQLNVRSNSIKLAITMSLPVMIGLGADEINVIVDRTIASTFHEGSISSLTYANTIVMIVHTVISVSINSVVFVEVSRYASEGKKDSVTAEIFSGTKKLLILLVPATFGMIAYAEPLVRCLYERGHFLPEHTAITAGILVCYALYIIPNGLRIVVQSYYYAYGQTRFCMYVGLIAVATNIVFNLVFSTWIGIKGLALATTLGICVASAILFVGFVIRNKEFPLKKIGVILLKTGIGSILMLLPSIPAYRASMLLLPEIVAVVIGVIVACLVYFAFVVFSKLISPEDISGIINKLLKRKGI